MKRGEIIIPQTSLEQRLARTAAIKRQMTELLSELEQTAAGQAVKPVGGWRQDPLGWAKKYLS